MQVTVENFLRVLTGKFVFGGKGGGGQILIAGVLAKIKRGLWW